MVERMNMMKKSIFIYCRAYEEKPPVHRIFQHKVDKTGE